MTTRTTVLTCTYEDSGLMPESTELTDNPTQAVPRIASWLEGLNAGAQVGSLSMLTDDGDAVAASATITVSGASHGTAATGSYALSGVGGTAATGSYALSGVGGTAASNTVTLGGGAGDVTVVTDGTSVGPVSFNTSDAQTALDVITALEADGTFAAKATATSGGSGIITITWDTKGTVGNSKTLTASRTAGTATVGGNGTTLGGGAQGAVTVAIAGTSIGPTDTTNMTDTDAATAVAAAIEANGTIGPQFVAAGSTNNVNLTWGTKGTVGNAVTLGVGVSATGTATRSGATLTGGAQGAVTVGINGTTVGPVDTTNLSDTAAATAVAAAIEANGTLGPLLAAVGSTTNVNITWGTAGTVGNAVTLAVGVSDTGTATRSGATLSGGADTSVTVTINGVGVNVDTTTTTTDAQVATAIKNGVNASSDDMIDGVVTATNPTSTSVGITADTKGDSGNWITLAVSGTGLSASGTRLENGADATDTATLER